MGGDILKSKIIALCDTDEIYCDRFLNYYMNHKVSGIEFITYTSEEILLKDTQKKDISIYLLTDTFLSLKLCEEEKCVIYFSNDRDYKASMIEKDRNCEHSIFKFQAIDAVLRELFQIESESSQTEVLFSKENLKEVNLSSSKIISIFSPSNEDVQSFISISIAKQIGKQKKVLYLNLIENSGMEELFEENFEEDISDFFYYLKQDKSDLQERLQGFLYHTRDFDYIPAAFQSKGLYELSEKEREKFFLLLHVLKYDVIIIDFGNSIMGLEELCKASDSVYCITREKWTSQIRLNHFMKTMLNFEEEKAKIQVCAVPLKLNTLGLKQCDFIELEATEIAAYAKTLMQNVAI